MRYAFLVAWREFAENAKTKGFWIGILIFPLMIWLSFSVGTLIEKTKSVRHFVLIDQSGELEGPIENALERGYQRDVMRDLKSWAVKNGKRGMPVPTAEMLEAVPAP